jgi:hypothetical protein
MFVDPKVEKPTRTMIGNVIREEFDDLETEMRRIGNDMFERALVLCIFVSGYVAVEVPEGWPTDADLREIARHTSVSAGGFELSQDDVFAFLSRVALGNESMAKVFPSPEVGVMLPLQVASTLLLAFRPRDKDWWEYLDVIEYALDAGAQVDRSVLPALMLFSRRDQAAKKQ